MKLHELRKLIRFAFEKLPKEKGMDFVYKNLKEYIDGVDREEK